MGNQVKITVVLLNIRTTFSKNRMLKDRILQKCYSSELSSFLSDNIWSPCTHTSVSLTLTLEQAGLPGTSAADVDSAGEGTANESVSNENIEEVEPLSFPLDYSNRPIPKTSRFAQSRHKSELKF